MGLSLGSLFSFIAVCVYFSANIKLSIIFEIREFVGNSSSFGKIVFIIGENIERLFQNQRMKGEEEGI